MVRLGNWSGRAYGHNVGTRDDILRFMRSDYLKDTYGGGTVRYALQPGDTDFDIQYDAWRAFHTPMGARRVGRVPPYLKRLYRRSYRRYRPSTFRRVLRRRFARRNYSRRPYGRRSYYRRSYGRY